MDLDLNIKIGGKAGQGLNTIGSILEKTFHIVGMHVFSSQYYLSRVRGGHNYFEIRIANKTVQAKSDKVDILVVLDNESIDMHLNEVQDGGIVLIDKQKIKTSTIDEKILDIPFQQIAKDVGGNKLFENSVAVGTILGLLCMDMQPLEHIIHKIFQRKGENIVDTNIKTANAGYEYVQKNYYEKCKYSFEIINEKKNRMLINGNDAVGLGALAAGVQYVAAYPMTPSTSTLNFIASHAQECNVIVEQAEDEICALNMILGTTYAGARSMTTTSGGGFCLMVEALSLAGMIETPAVIYLSQRPGPATGLPTMTEQADLLFAVYAAHGEFTRCILAPKTPEDAFYLTMKAFNLADKYHIPVIILGDQYLADSHFTCDRFDTTKIKIERNILADEKLKGMGEYNRYTVTDNGISPRALPMQTEHLVIVDSDEHNQKGHIDQTAKNRILMVDKRLRKIDELIKEMTEPEIYGPYDADITLVGWGSSYGPLKETVDVLNNKGENVNLLHFNHIYPMNKIILQNILNKCKFTVCTENNATGQFAKLLKTEINIIVDTNILRYDGLPFTSDYIINSLKQQKVI